MMGIKGNPAATELGKEEAGISELGQECQN